MAETESSIERVVTHIQKLSHPHSIGVLTVSAAAATLNKQEILHSLIGYGFSLGLSPKEFYETFLQLYLFAGFPAALEALATLHRVLREHNRTIEIQNEPYDIPLFAERGETLCQQIYTTAYGKMRQRIGSYSPDMDQWMIVEGYGKTLSRPGLSLRIRELITVAVLAVSGWHNQLHSHIRGATNAGATRSECEMVLQLNSSVFSDIPMEAAFATLQRVFE